MYKLITYMLTHPPLTQQIPVPSTGPHHAALIPTVEDWGIIQLSEPMKILSFGLIGAFCISRQIWHLQPANENESLGSQ